MAGVLMYALMNQSGPLSIHLKGDGYTVLGEKEVFHDPGVEVRFDGQIVHAEVYTDRQKAKNGIITYFYLAEYKGYQAENHRTVVHASPQWIEFWARRSCRDLTSLQERREIEQYIRQYGYGDKASIAALRAVQVCIGAALIAQGRPREALELYKTIDLTHATEDEKKLHTFYKERLENMAASPYFGLGPAKSKQRSQARKRQNTKPIPNVRDIE